MGRRQDFAIQSGPVYWSSPAGVRAVMSAYSVCVCALAGHVLRIWFHMRSDRDDQAGWF